MKPIIIRRPLPQVPQWTTPADKVFTQGVPEAYDVSAYVTAPSNEALIALAEFLGSGRFAFGINPARVIYDGGGALMSPTDHRLIGTSGSTPVQNMQIRRNGTLIATQYTLVPTAMAAMQSNDILEIEPKFYPGNHAFDCGIANVTMRSSVPGQIATFGGSGYAKGMFHRTTTAAGIVLMEDIDWSGVVDGGNSGGYWPEGGAWQYIARRCKFHNFNNGHITGPHAGATALLEYCEVYDCGDGSGSTHNSYWGGIDSVIYRGCYLHDCDDGHLIKSRAKLTRMEYCLMRSGAAANSREFEAPCAGSVTLLGCLIIQDGNSANGDIIGYGGEYAGTPNGANCPADGRTNFLDILQSSIINYRGSAVFVSTPGGLGLPAPNYQDCVMAGTSAPVIAGSSTVALSAFVNEAAGDYRLITPVAGSQNWADRLYVHPLSSVARSDALRGAAV